MRKASLLTVGLMSTAAVFVMPAAATARSHIAAPASLAVQVMHVVHHAAHRAAAPVSAGTIQAVSPEPGGVGVSHVAPGGMAGNISIADPEIGHAGVAHVPDGGKAGTIRIVNIESEAIGEWFVGGGKAGVLSIGTTTLDGPGADHVAPGGKAGNITIGDVLSTD